ncbi:hypothetical protein CcrC1_gp186 [Caulobacter phage C1]|nr:hypothetical protein CcrC1_gp186 [Caulobacter phage C1]UTU08415.1 hypothetical protein CcrC2_gp187 [Caulobacter phage C2]UTU08932.1 hypothetical protein CcrJ4_gp181 [Caulobacter phage J4]UTU09488.1 hypothetical protein CcrBL47_gp202 [Caulobacter phage BL47]UTU10048.1 hypothetical protein CcrRB23_gp186 [Caulobacter phage RB23]WGN97083.1 hypothetical protein [Bertelyvirus sp.]
MSGLQRRLGLWLQAAFGGRFTSPQDRALRVLEEAVELTQAVGIGRDVARRMVEHVYDRPAGDPVQELAGVLNSTLLTATALGVDGYEEGSRELAQAWKRIDLIRAKQKDKVML